MEKTFAVIENDLVVNLIIADSLETAENITQLTCIEFYTPKIGDIYSDGSFISSIE